MVNSMGKSNYREDCVAAASGALRWLEVWPQPDEFSIPCARPDVNEADLANVHSALFGGWVSKGPNQNRVEHELSHLLGLDTLVVSNGSVALILALRALGIGRGDEVIVPAITYAATASAVVHVGATPVFCDVNLNDWTIDMDSVQRMTTPRTRAVMGVHVYGHIYDVEAIREWASRHSAFIVEDASEGLGGFWKGQPAGSTGDIGTLSFFGNKVITCGEGGAVTTRDVELLQRLLLLRGQGMDPLRQFYFIEPGYNFRLSNLASALLESQLNRLGDQLHRRNEIFSIYRERLGAKVDIQIPHPDSIPAPWLFTCRIPRYSRKDTLGLAKFMASKGIETRPVFYPLTDMPAFFGFPADVCENALDIATNGISLPTYSQLTNDQVEFVADILLQYLK